ncbi:4-carboxymuconolactone decarboxylase [Streptomyces sp. SAI-135]|uniref:carboxymuconolactone decarboxylase family protein n=1 Tax=unclassified Streptomyces TaxID=2593676 RepID=UPI002476BA93|nr:MULTISPECIES: carboxymuconolactone decarboxylase family protein [unclassified Streptomyces]MDH6513955.1 4-carboxymuconolactone decarboxylase [Streptomyces sp. SAI-090]MDH6621965.1 4-carboxymuconolactone decarboxylase [Streptomyces sp. SAI-135]
MPARIAGRLPGELDEQQAEVYRAITGGARATGPQAFPLTDEVGRLRDPFNAMLLSPPVGMAVQEMGAAVRYASLLTDRVREMATLVVAAHWNSTFEREAHEAVGRTCGLTDSELEALRAGELPALSDPAERAALRATLSLARTGLLDDREYYHAVAEWGERGLFELTALVGYYALLALQLRVFAGEGPEDRCDPPQTESGTR